MAHTLISLFNRPSLLHSVSRIKTNKVSWTFHVSFDHFWSKRHFLRQWGNRKVKIDLSLKPNHHITNFNQVKVVQIRDTHCRFYIWGQRQTREKCITNYIVHKCDNREKILRQNVFKNKVIHSFWMVKVCRSQKNIDCKFSVAKFWSIHWEYKCIVYVLPIRCIFFKELSS